MFRVSSSLQEDPYKLILLAKDPNHHCVTKADFFFADGQLTLVAGDEEGIMRVYEYNPQGALHGRLRLRRLRLFEAPI